MITVFAVMILSTRILLADFVDMGFQHDRWPAQEDTFRGMISVGFDTAAQTKESSVRLYLVIDVSQDLHRGITRGMVEGVEEILPEFSAGDQLSILTYSRSVRTLMPLTEISGNEEQLAQSLRMINSDRGRAYSAAFDRIQNLIDASPSGENQRDIILFTTLGEPDEGEDAQNILEDFISFSTDNSVTVHTLSYGENFREDHMLDLSEKTGGRALYVPRDSSTHIPGLISDLDRYITSPAVYDVNIELSHPLRSGLVSEGRGAEEEGYFINSVPMGGKKYIFFHVGDESLAGTDIDIEYSYRLMDGDTPRRDMTNVRIPDISEQYTYDNDFAPNIIGASILSHFLLYEAALVNSDEEYRRKFAGEMRRTMLAELETATRQIGSDEMQNVYDLAEKYTSVLYDEPTDRSVANLFKQIKYKLHDYTFGY
ncbi:MAG: VWA domain-containing protein [Fibrobacterota bacterium]